MATTPVPFVERNCTFTHNGRTYEEGGASMVPCSDGRWRGIVYESATANDVCTWRGEKIARAHFGQIYQGNLCRMQSVRFTWQGMTFVGRYCPDSSQAIRVRSLKGSPNA